MRNRRLFATTTLLAAALTLSLSACGPDETTAAGPAKSTGPSATANPSATTPASTPATAPATSAPVTAPPAPTQTPTPKTTPIGLPSSQPTPHPTTKPTTAKPTAAAPTPTPTPDCTAAANHPGHKVINATVAWGDPNRIGANATTFVCGPDVPNDGYYQAVAPNTGYTFAPGAKATLLGRYVSTDPSTAVSITDLLTHINQCVQHPGADGPHLCYGNNYDITVNGAGQITTITELYHP
ncbi:hypothetical protein [Kitasatospora sp. NBC_01302]|uniref:hypothetical protein n=1 Tax=Kitasatospora sp. NBC_01302 TaxID=2903575 RepID=UPI002E0DE9D9|nr:hypothetical protein OG294_22980 [Kitasatospora sp. NBC_01302]